MASLVTIPNSPFWYLSYKDGGRWLKKSTGLRTDDPKQTLAARQLRAEAEAKEHGTTIGNADGWEWVSAWINTAGHPTRTLEVYLRHWGWISMWLLHSKLGPGDVRYEHATEYLSWRTNRKKKTGKAAGRNTAIQEIKFFSMIMAEAVPRRLIRANPLVRLRLRKDPTPKKPELTDEEVATCLAALKRLIHEVSEKEWMLTAFEISLATGCRLRETRIPMDLINLDLPIPEMTFPSPKGGESKSFTIPIPSSLIPLFTKLKREKQQWTIEAFPFQPSRAWQHFFKSVGLSHLTFHCLRVTKVTRLRREGVPREVAMRLVNHSTELIHMLYDRHQTKDLADFRDAGISASFSK